MPFISSSIQGKVQRLDIVWDTYPKESLKLQAQEKRASGTVVARTVVKESTPIPTNWKYFLQNRENKISLFRFLSKAVVDASANISQVVIYSTIDELVIVNAIHGKSQSDLHNISPCNHEEADGRIFLHLADASQQGHSKASIRTVDSDVVVIGISMFEHLGLQELWIDFGTGKAHRHIYQCILLFKILVQKSVVPCHYFIPSRGVIPHLHSWGLVKRLHRQHGTHSLTSQKLW